MLIDVVIPALGESISEVEIGEWRKPEGAAVEREFGCKIPPTEIDVHLESVHTLAAFIAERRGA